MTSRFKNLKQRDLALISIAVTLFAAMLWYFYLYSPTQDHIAELEGTIIQLDAELARAEAARQSLPELRLAVAELERQRLEFLAQLPREHQVAELIEQLRGAASDAGVVIEGLNQSGARAEDVASVRPLGFSLTVSGTYGTTMNFLQALEDLRRFTTIGQVSLSADNDEDDPLLTSNFTFTVYVFTGEDPGES